MTDLPLEPRGEARRVKLLLRQIDTLPGTRLLQQLRALIKTPPKTPQHRQNLAHALRNAATRINALANQLDNALFNRLTGHAFYPVPGPTFGTQQAVTVRPSRPALDRWLSSPNDPGRSMRSALSQAVRRSVDRSKRA